MTLYKATDPQGRSFRDPSVTWEVGKTTRHPTSTKMVANDASTYLSVSSAPADCTGFRWPCRLFEVEALPEGTWRYFNAETGQPAKLTPEGRPDGTERIRVVDLGETLTGLDYPNKVAGLAFRVVRELDATEALGPNGKRVAAFVERCKALTPDEAKRLDAARDAARDAAGAAAGAAAWDAARDAAWDAARDAAWDAARDAAGAAAWDAARDAAWDAAGDAAGAAAGDAARDAARAAAWDAARDAAWDAARDAARALIVQDLITPEQFAILTKPWRDVGLEIPE